MTARPNAGPPDELLRALVEVETARAAASAPGHAKDVDALIGAPGLLGVVLAGAEQAQDVHALGAAVTAPVIALVETAATIAAARQVAGRAARLALAPVEHLFRPSHQELA